MEWLEESICPKTQPTCCRKLENAGGSLKGKKRSKRWRKEVRQPVVKCFWKIVLLLRARLTFYYAAELQTFWLIKGNSGAHDSNDTSNYAASSAGDSDSEDLDVELSNQERWVDYNTEVFKGLLQQIVARRAGLRNSSSDFATKAVGERDASMPLEEVKEIIELPKFDKKAVRRQRENQDVEVPPLALKQLREYVSEVADLYNNDNPFHNFAHASNVVMAVNKYMNRIIAATEINLGDNEERYRSSVQAALHDHTYGITSDPLTLFAAAFSALIHDVDHPGVPNPQLIKVSCFACSRGCLFQSLRVSH